MERELTEAEEIAVQATRLDPRKMGEPETWSLYQGAKWFAAVQAAVLAFERAGRN